MTVMVRDEADIIGPMIDHHLAQGVDTIIVTDNGSVDGTFEILQSYGDAIVLTQDLVHRKQQHSVVTGMARDAYTRFGADWVINADADEFWLPQAGDRTLRDLFLEIPKDIKTFTVPVIDMIGAASRRGSGLQRLIYRDTRSQSRLNELGLHSHSTPDAVHIGFDAIEVAQGNHSVNLDSAGPLPAHLAMEVLHFPWRSWEQFSRKVENSGKAYESNPGLQPSPNHHGMREYRRWKHGSLLSFYVLRHPAEQELKVGIASGDLTLDPRIAERFASPVQDEALDSFAERAAREYGPVLSSIEREMRELVAVRDDRIDELLHYVDEGKQRIDGLIQEVADVTSVNRRQEAELRAIRARKIVRLTDAVSRVTLGRL